MISSRTMIPKIALKCNHGKSEEKAVTVFFYPVNSSSPLFEMVQPRNLSWIPRMWVWLVGSINLLEHEEMWCNRTELLTHVILWKGIHVRYLFTPPDTNICMKRRNMLIWAQSTLCGWQNGREKKQKIHICLSFLLFALWE